MSVGRYLSAIICDDVRVERGNKHSFMGVYDQKLIVPHLPFILPKLCFVITADAPADQPFNELTLRVLKDDETVGEIVLEPEALSARPAGVIDEDGEAKTQRVRAIVQMVPVHITKPCTFFVRGFTEHEVLKGGQLSVEVVVRVGSKAGH